MTNQDYYKTLGISRNADAETIKKSYRKLAMKYHPDRNKEDPESEEKFKQVGEAYAVLSNPEKRAQYDRFGHVGAATGGFGPMDIDPFEIFREFMGGFGFGDFFGGTAGNRGSRARRHQRGRDLQINLKLELEEIAEGTTKKIRVSRLMACESCGGNGAKKGSKPQTCSTCNGVGEVRQVTRSFFGQMVNVTTCPSCGGTGEINREHCDICGGEGRMKGSATVNVGVPAGVSGGHYLTLSGEGHAGPRGGPAGDLIVVFEEKTHKHFERHGDDILYSIGISIPEAVLGTEVEVPALEGQVQLEIPAGVQPGKILRMRGKGIRCLNSTGRGDQLVRISVWIPDKLDPHEKEMFEELAASEGLKPPKSKDRGFFDKVKNVFFGE